MSIQTRHVVPPYVLTNQALILMDEIKREYYIHSCFLPSFPCYLAGSAPYLFLYVLLHPISFSIVSVLISTCFVMHTHIDIG